MPIEALREETQSTVESFNRQLQDAGEEKAELESVEELRRLADLDEQGPITGSEFAVAEAKLLT